MSEHRLLVAARNLIEREGWRQDPFWEEGGFCAVIALTHSSKHVEPDGYLDAVRALEGVVGVQGPCAIGRWNDEPARTKEEVLAAFDCAISATAPEPADPLHGRCEHGWLPPCPECDEPSLHEPEVEVLA